MSKAIILTGYAIVAFRKVIEDVEDDEVEEMISDIELQELQIDEDNLRDIDSIQSIKMEVRP